MCETDIAIEVIEQYINEHLLAPYATWDKYEFKKRSYERWAAYEICEKIMDSPLEDPSSVIETFMLKAQYYADICELRSDSIFTLNRGFIFKCAANIAEELLSLFV